MYLKPYLAKLGYNAEIEYILPESKYKEGTILDINNITIFTHYKIDNNLYRLVFETDIKTINSGIGLEYVKEKENKKLETRKFDNRYFFVEYLTEEEQGKFDSSTAGYRTINIINSNKNIIDVIDIKILPASITYNDYLNIINDLIKIKSSLIYAENKKTSIGQSYIKEQESYLKEVQTIYKVINRILINPKYKLKKEYNTINAYSTGKVNKKLVIDKAIHPYKYKYNIESSVEDINIYENRMIKLALNKILLTINRYSMDKENSFDYIEKRLKSLNNSFLSLDNILKKRTSIGYNILKDNSMKKQPKEKDAYFLRKPFSNENFKFDKNTSKFIFEFYSAGRRIQLKTYDIVKIKYLYDAYIRNEDFRIFCLNNCVIKNTKDVFEISDLKYVQFKKEFEQLGKNYSFENSLSFISNKYEVYGFENLGFLNSIDKRLEKLKSTKEQIKRLELIDIKKNIENLLKNDMFKKISLKNEHLKATQIFNSDPNYNKLFRLLNKLDKQTNFLTDVAAERLYLKTTPKIYEYWCYYKMVSVLISEMGWELISGNNLKNEILGVLENKKIDSNRTIILKHKTKDEDIYLDISYEKETLNKKTPDYTFEFSTKKDGIIGIAYVDAKYRNYSEQGEKQFKLDLEEVALKKYYLGKEKNIISSFIIHSENNEKYITYGAENLIYKNNEIVNINNLNLKQKDLVGVDYIPAENHIGAFSMTPSNVDYFKRFITMLLEYHLEKYDICWNCGCTNVKEEVRTTGGGFSKYYYTCPECNEFWVKSHCSGKSKFQIKGNHDLIKHVDNYHYTLDNWFVLCPKCFDGLK